MKLKELKDTLVSRGQTKEADLPSFHVEEDWMDPPLGVVCWIFSPTYRWVAKGRIDSKREGDKDTLDTWRVHIFHVEEGSHGYMAGVTETCTRSQIWPTMKQAYSALQCRLEDKETEHEQQIKKLNERIREIEKFI